MVVKLILNFINKISKYLYFNIYWFDFKKFILTNIEKLLDWGYNPVLKS